MFSMFAWPDINTHSLTQQLCRADELQLGRNSCPWLPLPAIAMRMREVPARLRVGVCVPLASRLHYFRYNRIKFNLFTVFHGISKQIQQRARVGKIFARWHLAIAITSSNLNVWRLL